MQFEGCDPIGDNTPTIEISSKRKVWDIHNAGELLGICYKNKERILILFWDYYAEAKKISCRIKLSDVIFFETKRRDPEIPFSEDDCLTEFTISGNIVTFKFWGGMEIQAKATVFHFEVDE